MIPEILNDGNVSLHKFNLIFISSTLMLSFVFEFTSFQEHVNPSPLYLNALHLLNAHTLWHITWYRPTKHWDNILRHFKYQFILFSIKWKRVMCENIHALANIKEKRVLYGSHQNYLLNMVFILQTCHLLHKIVLSD